MDKIPIKNYDFKSIFDAKDEPHILNTARSDQKLKTQRMFFKDKFLKNGGQTERNMNFDKDNIIL